MVKTFLPCPHCGDDDTFEARPSGPKPCGCCGVRFGVGRVEGGEWQLVEASTARKNTPRRNLRPGKRGARRYSKNTAREAAKDKRNSPELRRRLREKLRR